MKLPAKITLFLFLVSFADGCRPSPPVALQSSTAADDSYNRNEIDKALQRAIENQDVEKIKELAEQVKETTPLFKAVQNGNTKKVRELLEQGADASAVEWRFEGRNSHYYTALWKSIVDGNELIGELLLQHGADVNKISVYYDSHKKCWTSYSALHEAIMVDYSNYQMVNEEYRFDNHFERNLEWVKLLAAHGASIKDEKGILFQARGDELIGYLLANGADINEQNENEDSILTYWEVEPDLATLEKYLKFGANPYLKNKYGKNAFDAVRAAQLFSSEVYAPYLPEEKKRVVLHKNLSASQKRNALRLMKKYGAKFLEAKSN